MRRHSEHPRVSATIILLLAIVVLALAGCGGSKPAYPPAARPALPAGLKAPAASCPALPGGQHVMGQCLPKPAPGGKLGSIPLKLSPTQSLLCVDLSNNDPVYSRAAWQAIARRVSCAIFKVNEGTGYVDGTAAAMASVARSVGLTVSGYDFQHVCGDSAIQEADVFAYHLKADGLTGPHTLPGWGDVEYGNGSCGARGWESTWHARVTHDLGREPGSYTGAWFWNPTFGCSYWPGGYSWISGYGVAYPFMPCGHSQLGLFQNSDHGYNGYSNADLSFWYAGQKSYCAAIISGCAPPAPPSQHCLRARHPHTVACGRVRYGLGQLERRRAHVDRQIVRHHCHARHHSTYCGGWFYADGVLTLKIARYHRQYA